jgi:hypothetical protein
MHLLNTKVPHYVGQKHSKGDVWFMSLYSTRSDCRRQLLFNRVALELVLHQEQSSRSDPGQ